MKLVDILAREMKVWPEGSDYIVQDRDGECWPSAGNPENARLIVNDWSTSILGFSFNAVQSCDWYDAKVTRAQWLAAVDTMAAQDMHDLALGSHADDAYLLNGIGSSGEQVSYPFKGEVLPSVGTKVKIYDDGSLVYGHGESGEVIAYVEDCAVVRMSYGLGCFMAKALITAEQVEAEEQQDKWLFDIAAQYDQATANKCAAILVEGGYRKP